jgi:Tol biopolymer transport system component
VAGTLVVGVALPARGGDPVPAGEQELERDPANGGSYTGLGGGALSGDGNLVAFSSNAANLPGGDGSTYRVYVRDFDRGRTTLVSKDNDGDPAEGNVSVGAISANGRFVVFHGLGDGLPGADGSTSQVWIHDRRTGRTRLVSRANDGTRGDRNSLQSSVSADGRVVAFYSNATNFPGGDGTTTRVYVRDLERGKTVLASKTNGGQPAFGLVYGQSISSTGRFVAFESFDDGLPSGDGNLYHICLRDLERRRTTLIDRTRDGQVADNNSY